MPVTPAGRPGAVLRGVDRAAFAVALSPAAAGAGVPVSLTAMSAFTDALGAAPPAEVHRLYWLARLTLVHRQQDIELFDGVFAARSATRCWRVDPHARRTGHGAPEPTADAPVPCRASRARRPAEGPACRGTPCRGLVRPTRTTDGSLLPELLPSAVARLAETPFDELDAARAGGARPVAGAARPTAGRPAAAGGPGRAGGHRVAMRRDHRPHRGAPAGSRWSSSARPVTPAAAGHAAVRRQPVDAGLRRRRTST